MLLIASAAVRLSMAAVLPERSLDARCNASVEQGDVRQLYLYRWWGCV